MCSTPSNVSDWTTGAEYIVPLQFDGHALSGNALHLFLETPAGLGYRDAIHVHGVKETVTVGQEVQALAGREAAVLIVAEGIPTVFSLAISTSPTSGPASRQFFVLVVCT